MNYEDDLIDAPNVGLGYYLVCYLALVHVFI
jgi:hypothetical protein